MPDRRFRDMRLTEEEVESSSRRTVVPHRNTRPKMWTQHRTVVG